MEDHNTDILCVQESKIPSNSFFRFKDYICIISTDLKGGEKPLQKTTKAVPEQNEPTIEPDPMDHGYRKTENRMSER